MAISRASDSSIQDGLPKYNDIWDGTTAVGSMDAISFITLGSSQTAIEFNNIPQTYSHLQIRFFTQTNRATIGRDSVKVYLNADTTTSYTSHALTGDGTTAQAYANGASGAFMELGYVPSSAATNFFGSCIIDILDYTNTSKYTTCRSISGGNTNGSVGGYGGNVGLQSGVWLKTTAVSSVTLIPYVGTTFSAYSNFALYGVK